MKLYSSFHDIFRLMCHLNPIVGVVSSILPVGASQALRTSLSRPGAGAARLPADDNGATPASSHSLVGG